MSAVIPFDFETNAVRVVMVDGEPWFVAVDVCRVLEIANSRDAVSRLDDDERQIVNLNTVGITDGIPQRGVGNTDGIRGNPNTSAVSESGLYALIMMSRKPAAKRFRKWVTAEVLTAIRRDGAYFQPTGDRAELAAKRAYYEALPDRHKEKASAHVEALRRIETLIAEGSRVGVAVAQVAEETGMSVRSLYLYRRTVYMVPGADHSAALAPRWNGARGMLAECHPEALALFLRLYAGPGRISDCYDRMLDEANANGWSPVPCQRTMRRAVQRLLPPKSKKEAA